MKTVLTSVLLCAFLQMVWLSLSTGQTDSASECSDFKNNSSQCCKNASCIFYQCNTSDSDGNCVSSGANPPECPANGTATATCNFPSTTANPGDPCSDKTSKNVCCGVDQCGFFQCEKEGAASTGVCALNDSTSACKEGTQSNNTCGSGPTPTPPTPPHPAADACGKHNNSKAECCAAASTDGCVFYQCKDITVCLKNSTPEADVCSVAGESPVVISCTETTTPPPPTTTGHTTPPKPTSEGPTTSTTPTKAPSGSGSGGRHFDGASFIGGIVLCAGIFAIGYFGLKFYKSRQERNYHTL